MGYNPYANLRVGASGIGQRIATPVASTPATSSSQMVSTPSGSTPVSSQGTGGQVDYSALLKAFGGVQGIASMTQPTQAQAPTPLTNVSTPNPTINKVNEAQLATFGGDMNAGALGRQSDIAIRDNAENERKALRESMSSRGVSGGGLADVGQAAISRDTIRAQSGARAAITNDAEARRASLGGQIANQAALDENLQNQQRSLALNQQQLAAQQQQAADQHQLDRISQVLNLFGSVGLFG